MTDIVSSQPPRREVKCVEHGESPEAFCVGCQLLVCGSCISGSHLGHKCGETSDVFPRQHQDIVAGLGWVRRTVSAFEDIQKMLVLRKKMVSDKGESVKDEVRFNTKLVIQKFLKHEEELVGNIDHIVENKLRCLTQQEEQAERLLAEMRRCVEYVERSVQFGNTLEILSEKQRMMQSLQTAQNTSLMQPEEEPSFKFVSSHPTCILGSVHCTYASCRINLAGRIFPMMGKEFTAIFSFSTTVGDPIDALSTDAFRLKLAPVASENAIECSVRKVGGKAGNQYAACFTVQERGEHTLMVEVLGCSKSFSFYTTPSPSMRGALMRDPIVTGCMPYTVATSDDGLKMAAANNYSVLVFDCSDQQHRSSIRSKLYVYGVAFTGDEHLVTVHDHCVHKFTMSGDLVASLGGEEVGEFNLPRRVAVNPDSGEIFVVEHGGGRVKVLNRDLVFSRVFGENDLKHPYGIALDKRGSVYVANSGCHCINVYSPDGKPLTIFGSLGSSGGGLNVPCAVAIDSAHNLVYVADRRNNRIAVFDNSGRFVAAFGGRDKEWGELVEAFSVALDAYGNVYATGLKTNNIAVF